MKDYTIKILLIGSRYTGKGQIGRIWGQTKADLPTLQPVILYEKSILKNDLQYRVVSWVLSYDSEFEYLRSSFYPKTDGIIFTYDVTDPTGRTLLQLEQYKKEFLKSTNDLPPSVVFGVKLRNDSRVISNIETLGKKWAQDNNTLSYFTVDYTNLSEFEKIVEDAFSILISTILQE